MSPEKIKQLFDYDPETGNLIWKIRRQGTRGVGSIAGSINSEGYVVVGINGEHYKAQNIIWSYQYGDFPMGIVDHINRDRSDNRLINLRDCSRSKNGLNHKLFSTNTSGWTGVSYYKNRWEARFRSKRIGYYKTVEEAITARKAAEDAYCG